MTLYLTCDVWYQRVGDTRVKRVLGDELTDIDKDTAEWLVKNGSASTKKAAPVPEPKKVEPAPKPEKKKKTLSDIDFPAKTANINIWRDFGKTHGIDIKEYKTKAAIRAAVEAKYQD